MKRREIVAGLNLCEELRCCCYLTSRGFSVRQHSLNASVRRHADAKSPQRGDRRDLSSWRRCPLRRPAVVRGTIRPHWGRIQWWSQASCVRRLSASMCQDRSEIGATRVDSRSLLRIAATRHGCGALRGGWGHWTTYGKLRSKQRLPKASLILGWIETPLG
jgi:hypothetical protein